MRVVLWIVIVAGALLCLVSGLLGVLRDLLERGPDDSGLIAGEPPASRRR
jgi:hypothetical protein